MKKHFILIITCLLALYHCYAQSANRTLSNLLSPVAVNVDLLPGIDSSVNFGSSLKRWKLAYISSLNAGNVQVSRTLLLNAPNSNLAINNNTNALLIHGKGNTIFGDVALANISNGNGNNNIAFGYAPLFNNTNGSSNIALGKMALFSNDKGNKNIAIGSEAMYTNSFGNTNIAIGDSALRKNTSGYSNIAMGKDALFSNTQGYDLVAIGDSALYNQSFIDEGEFPGMFYRNTAVGSKALFKNTIGSNNTAVGSVALYSNFGDDNTALGSYSLYLNTTGTRNTAAGAHALYGNTGSYNVAFGAYSLSAASGSYNCAFGTEALFGNTSGTNNSAAGYHALASNTSGSYNTAIGYNALQINTTQSKNTAVGWSAGNSFASSASTFLGHKASSNVANVDNSMALGFLSTVTASNQVSIGNTSVTRIGGQVGWSTFSDGRFKKNIKENVPGLTFIDKLRPVTYNLELRKLEQFLGKNNSEITSLSASYDIAERKLHTGFIAQEVEKTAQSFGYDFDGVNHPQNEKDNYSLSYADFVVPLVKAVQELSKMNDEKDKQIAELTERVAKLENAGVTATTIGTNNMLVAAGDRPRLDQNNPNPSGASTTIGYHIPLSIKSAQIAITDMNGRTITQQIIGAATNSFIFNTGNLSSGTYTYTLYCDGKLIDSKKMLVSK